MSSSRCSFPLNLSLSSTCTQGGRKYMEDSYCISYQKRASQSSHSSDHESVNSDIEFVFFGIFDGHGGHHAAHYARDHLCENIIRERSFWSNDDADDGVLQAIRRGFITTHYDMLKEVGKWPQTGSGLPSTSGTTASVIFIRNGKYYTGHVGDSKIVLGRYSNDTRQWMPFSLTRDHKPESTRERKRIEAAGGTVMNKSGVDRVVWNRPKSGHKGPVRRSTSFEQIPFLAVARSLGDLWSFNAELNTFVVSPEPDVSVIPIDPSDRCILLASDGLWNVMTTTEAICMMQDYNEKRFDSTMIMNVFGTDCCSDTYQSPSRMMVHYALHQWCQSRFRADNATVVAVTLHHRNDVNGADHCPNVSLNSDNVITMIPDNEREYLDSDDDDSGNEEDSADYGDDERYDGIFLNLLNRGMSAADTGPVNEDASLETKPLVSDAISLQSFPSDNCTSLTELSSYTPSSVNDSQPPPSVPTLSSEKPLEDTCQSEASRDSGTESPIIPSLTSAITDDEFHVNHNHLSEKEYRSLPSMVVLTHDNWELQSYFDPIDPPLKNYFQYNYHPYNNYDQRFEFYKRTTEESLNKEALMFWSDVNSDGQFQRTTDDQNLPLSSELNNCNQNEYHSNGFSHDYTSYSLSSMHYDLNNHEYHNSICRLMPPYSMGQYTSVKPRSMPSSAVTVPSTDGNDHPQHSSASSLSTVSSYSQTVPINKAFEGFDLCILKSNNFAQSLNSITNCNDVSVSSDGDSDGHTNGSENDNRNINKDFSHNFRSLSRRRHSGIESSERLLQLNNMPSLIQLRQRTPQVTISIPRRKRKFASSITADHSPPSKRLRSSLWIRPKFQLNLSRGMRTLTSDLTRSRLRPIRVKNSQIKRKI